MTRAQGFVLGYAVLALLWAVPVLYATQIRLSARDALDTIRSQNAVPTDSEITVILKSYSQALVAAPCDAYLHKDRILLLAQRADTEEPDEDIATSDRQLSETQQAVRQWLACKPADGKAWLDYASITLAMEGFSPKVRHAIAMSARVSPNESWLAAQRVAMALALQPMFDNHLRALILHDLDVLNRGNHWRLAAIMKSIKPGSVTSFETLQALFRPQPEPTSEQKH